MKRVLVGGIGNIFFGDDGFGVEVVRRLAARPQPEGVSIVDFGIRGFDLGYALLETYDAAILVDAMSRGGSPGTLYVVEPSAVTASTAPETHAMVPSKVLAFVETMGGSKVSMLRFVGCEPAVLGDDDELVMGLSDPVARAIDGAIELVEEIVHEVCDA